MKFNDYVMDWFTETVNNHIDNTEWCKRVYEIFECDLADQIGESAYGEYLLANIKDPYKIYTTLFGYNKVDLKRLPLSGVPDTESFLEKAFLMAAKEQAWPAYVSPLPWVREFVEDMAYHASNYIYPDGFFEDLNYGGVASGIAGYIYDYQCKETYLNYIDDLEDYAQNLEEELGESIQNTKHLRHYTFVCWVCYEELAHKIADTLWEL